MNKSEMYRERLRSLDRWDDFLLRESGLPGPRGNLELAQAVADEGDERLFLRYLEYDAERAPVNEPHEFLAFCGAVGLGRLVAQGQHEYIKTLRRCASDARWRMREAVAMALQRWGDRDMNGLVSEMIKWSQGNLLEQRAAAAALCEPRLLVNPVHARAVLDILDAITGSLGTQTDRRSHEFQALRKGLGYCWSVAVVALPADGKPRFERWLLDSNIDITWVIKENLKKSRLARMDAAWVSRCNARLDKAAKRE